MFALLASVVGPVFLIVALGFIAAKYFSFPAAGIDGLNRYVQRYAIPLMLFEAVRNLNFTESANATMLASYYGGGTLSFILGYAGARYFFKRRPGEAVAIGFTALFSNTVLLGLPISERAYGADTLGPNFAIIALNAPFCYLLGIASMEALRSDGRTFSATVITIVKSVFSNPLMIGIGLGVIAKLLNITMPEIIKAALDMMARSGIPVALFALGGVLTRYTVSDKIPQVLYIAGLCLIFHPLFTWLCTQWAFNLDKEFVRSSVISASMAPGINAYIFASMYDRATGVVSAAVLLCTLLSALTVPVWLSLLA